MKLSHLLFCTSLAGAAGLLAVPPAEAQLQCTSSATSASCTNTGTIAGGTNNQARVNGPGDATFTNTGTIGDASLNQAFVNGDGTATFNNSGTIGNDSLNQAFVNGIGSATFTNSGTIGNNSSNQANVQGDGAATFTNSGSIGNSSSNQAFAAGSTGTATLTNSGTIGNSSSNQANVQGNGAATFTNSGTIGNLSNNQAFVDGSTGTSTATLTNTGTIGNNTNNQANVQGDGTTTFTNRGTIGSSSFNQAFVNGSGNATFTNSGFIGSGTNQANVQGTGNAVFVNAGGIIGSVGAFANTGTADLINKAGSFIAGSITLAAPFRTLEFIGGNYVYTINSVAFVTINSHGAPFVISGNTVAVFDPTATAIEDRSVMNFTNGVSSMLQDRFGAMGASGSGSGAPMSFAPEIAGDRIGGAHDAFSSMPSLSMSYASDDSKARNAQAMYTKAPAAQAAAVNDITVWTSGFGGERRQSAYDTIQAARDTAYGAAIGIDRQYSPYLRLGVFGGGGNSRLRTDFSVDNVDSNYGFGGGYGRYDMRNYFVDFALFGGAISARSNRLVANNTVPGGLETATASYDGWFISPDVTWGYRLFTAYGTITPKARVRYVGGSLDGYSETGSVQGVTIGKRSISDVEERLGVELANTAPVDFGGTLRTTLEFSGVGLQRLGDNTINATLLAQNIAFTTPGKRETLGGAVTAGLDWRPMNNVSVYVSAEGIAMDDKSYSYVGKGGLRLGF